MAKIDFPVATAVAATDFASLQSAIVTALADI